jgi:thioesterase domain-containing protein
MQVTAANFESMLPELTTALEESDFISFDCEMTGSDDTHHKKMDDMASRYAKVCSS